MSQSPVLLLQLAIRHDELEHSATPFAGSAQLLPHTPQFVFVVRPPFEQTCPSGHALPHVPQLALSVAV